MYIYIIVYTVYINIIIYIRVYIYYILIYKGCPEGEVKDCEFGWCCDEGAVGDGFCEDELRPFYSTCNLQCYNNDGGDCWAFSDGSGEPFVLLFHYYN